MAPAAATRSSPPTPGARRAAGDTEALASLAELAAAFQPSKERHLETDRPGDRLPGDRHRRLADRPPDGRSPRPFRREVAYPIAVGDRRGGPRRAARRDPAGHAQRLRRQSRLRRRARHAARPDRRPAHHRRPRSRSSPRSRWRREAATLDDLGGAAHAGRHRIDEPRDPVHEAVPLMSTPNGPLRVGIGGPVGSGKTALMDALCKTLRDRYAIAAITNDIYTREDAEFLTRSGALAPSASSGWRPAAARTPPSARTPRSTSPPSPTSGALPRPRPGADRIRAATTSPPPSRPSSPTSPSTSSTSPPATRSRARAAPASPAPTSWSSTRSTSPRSSAPRWR